MSEILWGLLGMGVALVVAVGVYVVADALHARSMSRRFDYHAAVIHGSGAEAIRRAWEPRVRAVMDTSEFRESVAQAILRDQGLREAVRAAVVERGSHSG